MWPRMMSSLFEKDNVACAHRGLKLYEIDSLLCSKTFFPVRTREWPSALRVHFIVIQVNVAWAYLQVHFVERANNTASRSLSTFGALT